MSRIYLMVILLLMFRKRVLGLEYYHSENGRTYFIIDRAEKKIRKDKYSVYGLVGFKKGIIIWSSVSEENEKEIVTKYGMMVK